MVTGETGGSKDCRVVIHYDLLLVTAHAQLASMEVKRSDNQLDQDADIDIDVYPIRR